MSRKTHSETAERETERKRVTNYVTSRRKMLAGTAGIGATLLAGCSGGDEGTASTETPDEPMSDPTETPTEEPEPEPEPIHPDVSVLNYALTLEHLEYAFYRDGVEAYSDEELMNADVLDGFGKQVRMTVPDRLRTLRDHEKAHVDAIVATVNDLGGDPVEEATYDFGYGNPSEFLAVAKALENTGVAAYAGAAPTVQNDDIFGAAAAIHDVEARHASFLNELNMENPFPEAFDGAKSMDEVVEIAGQFIVE